MKIRGNTVGTTMKRPDFNQTDERKSDYIKNNPIPVVNEEDEGKIPVVEDGAYVLKEKNSILELVQEIFAFDEEGPSTKKAPSQLATLNALERYMPSGAFNSYVEETIIPMQKRIGTLETTSEAYGEAISGMGNAIDEIASEMHQPYELLYDVTIAEGEEEVYEMLITRDKDGQHFNLSAFYMVINFPVSNAEKTIDGHVGAYNAQGNSSLHLINLWTNKVTSTTAAKYFFVSGRCANGMWYDVWKSLQTQNNKDASVTKVFGNHTSLVTNLNRSRMEFRIKFGSSSHSFDVGTRIRIFGVKSGGNGV